MMTIWVNSRNAPEVGNFNVHIMTRVRQTYASIPTQCAQCTV